MAIMTEDIGGGLTRTWSDAGVKIERNVVRYCDAIDPTHLGRTYIETDDKIEEAEASEADKDAALRRFGVEV